MHVTTGHEPLLYEHHMTWTRYPAFSPLSLLGTTASRKDSKVGIQLEDVLRQFNVPGSLIASIVANVQSYCVQLYPQQNIHINKCNRDESYLLELVVI